jgi:general secretion pathway protein I
VTRRSSGASGFTLLEVLVAIAILGVGMTAILSAQTGLFASSSYAERISLATGLVRCKMSELELKLSKDGYPLVDVKDEGPCCADDSIPGYRCKWKVEKVELPQPPTSTDLSSKLSGGLSGLGSLGAIASVGQTNGAALGQNPGLGGISQLLAGQAPAGGFGMGPTGAPGSPAGSPTGDFGSTPFGTSSFGQSVPGSTPPGAPIGGGAMPGGAMGGASSLAPLVMSLVYPTLKPMLEASIRKLTITVEWQQGSKTQNLEAVQFVTNPMQGGIDPNAAQGMDAAFSALGGLLGGQPGGAAPKGSTK